MPCLCLQVWSSPHVPWTQLHASAQRGGLQGPPQKRPPGWGKWDGFLSDQQASSLSVLSSFLRQERDFPGGGWLQGKKRVAKRSEPWEPSGLVWTLLLQVALTESGLKLLCYPAKTPVSAVSGNCTSENSAEMDGLAIFKNAACPRGRVSGAFPNEAQLNSCVLL